MFVGKQTSETKRCTKGLRETGQETEEFKQSVAKAIANSDGKTPPKIEIIIEEGDKNEK